MCDEYFDVLNEEGRPSGVIRRRKSCHALGLPHRVAHVWLMNSYKEKKSDLLFFFFFNFCLRVL